MLSELNLFPSDVSELTYTRNHKEMYIKASDAYKCNFIKEDKSMIGRHEVRRFVYIVVGGVLFSGLVIATQIPLANQTYADEGHEASGPTVHCNGPAQSHRFGKGGAWMHHGRHNCLWKALKQIDLTAEQKTAIQEIRSTLMKDMIQKRADIKIARIELRERLHKDSVDMGGVEAQVKKIEGLKTAMMINSIKVHEEIKARLTPDQRKKLTELMQKSHRDHHIKQAG
jgi:Spy/CpxP family protein refolding chaperone